MRIPSHAAVSASVDLATPRERGFVNAILRKLADDPPAAATGSTDEAISTRTGMAPWAVEELRLLLGDDEAEVAAEAFGERGLLSLRVNTCVTSVDAFVRGLRASGHTPRAAQLHPDCVLLDGGDPARLRGFAQGWFAVQDQASAFVVRALDPQPGERVLDVCAAPGGKAAHVACLVGETGRVVAGDVRPERAALVRSTAERLRVPVLVVAQDGDAPGDRRDLRPGAGGRAVLRHRVGAPAARAALAAPAGRALVARPAPGGDRVRGGRPAPSRRPPRLLGVHVPAGGDGRGVRRVGQASTRTGAEPIDGPDGPSPRVPAVAAPARFRRHVRRGLPQTGLTGRVR